MFPTLNATELWLLSNGLAAGGFAALALVLQFGIRADHRALPWLIGASLVSAFWFGLLVIAPILHPGGATLDLVESIRTGLWIIAALHLLPREIAHRPTIRTCRTLALGVAALLVLVAAVPFLRGMLATGTAPPGHGIGFVLLMIAASLIGLVIIEATYRASDVDARWAIKFACIALAALFAYDFVMYSGALIAHRIPVASWNARGFANLLAVPLIALAALRNDRWTSRVSVSQKALFSATVLIAAGLYLTGTAIVGMIIRRFGGSWAEAVALLFVVAAVMALVVLVSSGQVRGTARVLLRKHLLAYRYDYREQWLALTRRLGRSDDGMGPHERAIRAVAEALDCPGGAVWILRDERYVCAADWNLGEAHEASLPADSAFTAYLARTAWVVDITAWRRDAGPYEGLVMPPALEALRRARLILPLFAGGTSLIGFLVLASPRAAFELGWEELDLLKAFGQQVGVYLDHEESSRALAQARQFEAFNRLTAFLMHDLKNIAGQQSLIVQNARKHRENPAFIDDMIETVEYSVARMQRVLEQLGRVSQGQDVARRVEVDAVVDTVLDGLASSRPRPQRISPPCGAQVTLDADRLGMMLRHLLRNAQDATTPEGRVAVEVETGAGEVKISVIDDGVGMTPSFIRDELFQPFVSTKSARGMGIGAFQVRDFARACGGRVTVDSRPNEGTRFTLRLPCLDATHEDAPIEATNSGGTA
ncbi:XrtA/PEP-CTERM system histidine kinase PrsK [Salinisphaera sp. Q1T1-3]|uniref:XrtA/PEP-CTERM system histidine kinase PrsK n=1 Tax=Salinisphaera sp. Q1T1-3 TaxID=2321229 RepID=UPI000E751792|nr:XrtA/PEP-CTERM system histidine kinase PrsK [Salinisphaera sp. Q1T1-3]RJS94711.1 PEP-CTERM system histidine kinase PrsK [Salinisphaera sp. Q1T1-3]